MPTIPMRGDRRAPLLRPIRADDDSRLRAFFHRLTPETRYKRFHTFHSELSTSMVRYLVDVDGVDHVALVAIDERDRIIGVARVIRDPKEITSAEIAITVEDAYQGHGLGRRLMDAVLAIAIQNGVRDLVAYTLPNNKPMERLLEKLGPLKKSTWKSSYGVELRVALEPSSNVRPLLASLDGSPGASLPRDGVQQRLVESSPPKSLREPR